ncbi:MAG: hypothetical protein WC499_00440 [Patescibacteria group bacterium]
MNGEKPIPEEILTPEQQIDQEKNPEKLSKDFFEEKQKSVFDKIKNVLNILRPHELEDTAAKFFGTLSTLAGLEMSRIAFLNQEQMINIMGQALTRGEIHAAETLAISVTGMGILIFSEGIKSAIQRIKLDREIKMEKSKKI